MRLKDACENETDSFVLIYQALRISNDLYGNDVASSHELAKGYTRPVLHGKTPMRVPEEIISAHEQLLAKRKLTLIMRFKSTKDSIVRPGDMIQVDVKKDSAKRGKWLSPRPVLHYHPESFTVTIPGERGRTMKAAIEDIRPAFSDNALTSLVQESIDFLENDLEFELDTC